MLDRATCFIGSEVAFLPEHVCEELKAIIKDTYSYYYIKRNKSNASYQYLISAINIYKRRGDALNVAKCRLHQSYIQCTQHKYSDSMKSLKKILSMVDGGKLDDVEESDYNQVLLLTSVTYHNIAVQQLMLGHISDSCVSSQNARRLARMCLLLTSVTYHNIAVQQLMLGHISDSCVSSQNARRLARMCLSVSSHYLPMLEYTHKQSLNELTNVLKNSHCEEQALLFHRLISELFD